MKSLGIIIGENLIYLRKKAGLTQYEFGEKFNYSDRTVSKWELGDVIPNTETIKEIADFYGVSVDFILTEHTSQEDFFKIVKNAPNAGNKISLISLIITIILSIAVTIYIAGVYNHGTTNPQVNKNWLAFVWSVPVSALVIAILVKRLFGSRKHALVWLSVFIWTILLAAFFTFLYKDVYWYLFFIGIPVQACLIILMYMKK